MKVLLVKPISEIHVVSPPLSLAYLASSAKNLKQVKEVKILDCLLSKLSYKDFEDYIRKYKPDIIGLTAFTLEFPSALKMAKIAKKLNKNTKIVLGGPHVSNHPQDLKNKEIDFIFRGEGEEAFPLLIKELNKKKPNFKKIPNMGWKKKNKIILNEIKFIQDLNKLQFPDFELIDFLKYPKLYLAKKHPAIPLITSRGCPFSCTFCSAKNISGKKFRARTPENILEEIKQLKQKFNIKEFQFWDDNFTLDKERANKFCDLLIKENLDLIWWCPNGVRVETLDRELLLKMKKSGCYAMAFGIESGSEKIQKDMKKNLDLKKVKEIITFAHKIGIRTQGFFIIGYPTETKEDIEKTIKFAKSLPLDRASISLFQPLFGSEIYEDLVKQGKIEKDYNIADCDYSKASILPIGFKNLEEVKKMQRKALIQFYSRPKVFLKFISENLSLSQIKEIFKMIKTYVLGI